jgi:hypothetical protein
VFKLRRGRKKYGKEVRSGILTLIAEKTRENHRNTLKSDGLSGTAILGIHGTGGHAVMDTSGTAKCSDIGDFYAMLVA